VLPVLPFSARCRHCLASSSPFHTPPLAIGPRCRRSRLSAAHAESPAPRRPPLSCGNGAHTRRSGADANHSSYPPSRPGPPLPQYFSPLRGAKPRTPLPPFSSPLAPLGRDKSCRRPCSPFLPIFLLHLLRALPPPSSPLSLSASSPGRLTALLPEVRSTLASSLHLLGMPALPASWLASGLHLTLSLPHWHCRTLPPVPPVTRAPLPPWDIAAPPPLRPPTSSRCSGEPSLPPPCQVRCRRPHGAHAVFFGAPCQLEHADQPCRPATARTTLPRRGLPP
jgi:hypothetical protein